MECNPSPQSHPHSPAGLVSIRGSDNIKETHRSYVITTAATTCVRSHQLAVLLVPRHKASRIVIAVVIPSILYSSIIAHVILREVEWLAEVADHLVHGGHAEIGNREAGWVSVYR